MPLSSLSYLNAIESQIAASAAAAVGLAVHDLQMGDELLVRADDSFHAASTFKLCVMMEAYHQAQTGPLPLDERLAVRNEFSSIVDGSPFSLSARDDGETGLYEHLGESLPLRDLVRRMITRSSNLATNLLVERLGAERINAYMLALGAQGLLVRRGVEDNKAFALGLNNAATARGLMQILVRLAEGQVVSPQASEEMIAILKEQHFNEGIPAGLPAGVPVAHKTGWNDKLYHDAAIVFPPGRRPYVLAVLTRGLAEDQEAPALVAALSRSIYDCLTARP
jgi:beta-lactamase class A